VHVGEAEGGVDTVHQTNDPEDLVLELVGRAVDVGVVLGEVAHAEEAVEDAAHLVTVHLAELGDAHRQVAVRTPAALVDKQAAGAVHRLHRVRVPVDLGEVHVVLVVLPVAAAFPELAAQDLGRAHLVVAGAHVLGAPVVDHRVPDAHALGMEEGEAGALVVEAEQVEVTADAAVVALAGHLEGLEMRRQRLLRRKGGPVDAGEHGVALVAAPIGAGDTRQLEGALAEASRARQVRTAAEVGEPALRIHADRRHRLTGRLGRGDEVLDELDLEGLVRR